MKLTKEKKRVFFVLFIFSGGIFFNTCVSSQCIVYWIHFQNNIHFFRFKKKKKKKKKILQTLLLLVFKFAESLQCILNLCLWLLCEKGKRNLLKCSLFNFWLSPFKKLCCLLYLLEKHYALRLPFSPSFSPQLFRNTY